MEMWKFIKEEPEENQCYEGKDDNYNTLGSYSTYDPGKLYDAKSESDEDSSKVEETNQYSWKTAPFYLPKLSIPLVRLDYSQNKELNKYLKPLEDPALTPLTKLQLEEGTTKLDLNFKMECVELETLNNNTLMQFPKHDGYALPYDFVSVQGTNDFNCSMKDSTVMKFEDQSLLNNETPQLETRKNGASQKKYIQQTLNLGPVLATPRKLQDRDVETTVEATSKREPNQSFHTECHTPVPKSDDCHSCNMDLFGIPGQKQYRLCVCAEGCSKKQFICAVCGKPHEQKSHLRQHLLSHDLAYRYPCEVCGKRFRMKKHIRQHMKTHAGKKYTCDICQRFYSHRSSLIRHKTTHMVGTELRSPAGRLHKSATPLMLKKSKSRDQETIKSPLKPYECDVCGQRFENKSKMIIHFEFLHVELFGDSPSKLNGSSPSQSPCDPSKRDRPLLEKHFRCRTCRRSYTYIANLRRHEASHLPRVPQSYACGLCEQQFTRTSSLSRHMLTSHETYQTSRMKAGVLKKRPPKDFKCKICDKAFRTLADLRRHGAIHDARKPYECDTCKKQFAVKGYLYAHMLTHDNWKPYPCESCAKIFRRKSSLQRHIDISHSDEKIHKCKICSKTFKFRSTYRIHMGRFHPSTETKD